MEETVNQSVNLEEYQSFVRGTKRYSTQHAVLYPVIGLASEVGEVSGKIKKILRDQEGEMTSENIVELISELGDVLWYVTCIADDLGVPLIDLFTVNVAKLTDRVERGVIHGSGDNR